MTVFSRRGRQEQLEEVARSPRGGEMEGTGGQGEQYGVKDRPPGTDILCLPTLSARSCEFRDDGGTR